MRFGLREIVFFAVLLGVPVASFFFLFKPRKAEIAEIWTDIEEKQATLEQLAEVSNRIDDLGIAIEEGRKAIRLIEEKLPSAQGVDRVLKRVWELAERNQQVVKSVKTEEPIPAATYMESPLRVVMQGDFDGFYQFLLELENMPRITRIRELDIERLVERSTQQQDAATPGDMKAEFILSIYYEPHDMP